MKHQVVVIGGGETFGVYQSYLDWLRNLQIDLGYYREKSDWKRLMQKNLGEDYDVLRPEMPNRLNANYAEWKLLFDKIVVLLEPEVILVGQSLGASFLAKYLSENRFPKKLTALFLVAGCFDKDSAGNGLHTFAMPDKLTIPSDRVFLYHSQDDPVVPFSDLELFKKQLPNAIVRVFDNRGHFNQENFPEILDDIKNLH